MFETVIRFYHLKKIIHTNVYKDIRPLLFMKITNITELNAFLFINKKAFNFNEYSYILYSLFEFPIPVNFFHDLQYITNYTNCVMPISVIFKYVSTKKKSMTKFVSYIIEKLQLVENKDYTLITINNKPYHSINALTFLKCFKLTNYRSIIHDAVINYSNYLEIIIINRNSDRYNKYFVKFLQYFIDKNNIVIIP